MIPSRSKNGSITKKQLNLVRRLQRRGPLTITPLLRVQLQLRLHVGVQFGTVMAGNRNYTVVEDNVTQFNTAIRFRLSAAQMSVIWLGLDLLIRSYAARLLIGGFLLASSSKTPR